MRNSVIINTPWLKYPSTGIYPSSEQVQVMFNLAVKMFWYKYTFEKSAENKIDRKDCDLSDPKVFNLFVNEIIAKVHDPVAQDYLLQCLRNIKNANYNRASVRKSFNTLYAIFNPNGEKAKAILTTIAATNGEYFVDFLSLFEKAGKITLNDSTPEISELNAIAAKRTSRQSQK